MKDTKGLAHSFLRSLVRNPQLLQIGTTIYTIKIYDCKYFIIVCLESNFLTIVRVGSVVISQLSC